MKEIDINSLEHVIGGRGHEFSTQALSELATARVGPPTTQNREDGGAGPSHGADGANPY